MSEGWCAAWAESVCLSAGERGDAVVCVGPRPTVSRSFGSLRRPSACVRGPRRLCVPVPVCPVPVSLGCVRFGGVDLYLPPLPIRIVISGPMRPTLQYVMY